MRSLTCLFYAFVTFCLGLIASGFSSQISIWLGSDPSTIPSSEPWRTLIVGATLAISLVFVGMGVGYLFARDRREDDIT